SGLLTGKYDQGIPADARLGREGMEWLQDLVLGADAGARLGQVRRFSEVARALGQAPATLAIAWCLRNPNVSSVILGASRVSQLLQNLQA
ncbi:aldo/keto reductase, partial [Acinetobacter baumannii]